MIISLDHVGIAVNRIADVLPTYEKILGLKLVKIKQSEQQKIKAAVFTIGESNIELIEPLDEKSPIFKFLKKRGSGLHHIALKVNNIEQTLEDLKRKGIILIDTKPRKGIEGGKIAFLHPKSTENVLIELCEESENNL